MNRREMLRYTALISGGVASASFATVYLSGCTNPTREVSDLHFFEPEQFDLVSRLADTILPRTSSPSATDVNVHYTIDTMIGRVFDMDFKSNFRQKWNKFENHLTEREFLQLEQSGRVNILRNLELNRDSELEIARQVYFELKQQVIAYYLTTEKISREHLNYLPVPGYYEPCISVDEVANTAWAI
jgi:hypothetical protein